MSRDISIQIEQTLKAIKKYRQAQLAKAELDITVDQLTLMEHINDVETINQRNLANSLHRDPASITRSLELLVNKGIVRRENDTGDRREYRLYLTEEGKSILRKLLPLTIDFRAQGSKGLTQENIEKLHETLHQIINNYSS